MLDRLAVRPMLDGVRGAPPADLGSVAAALVRLSVLAEDLGDHLDALDVNPLICGPNGCVAVDALVLPERPRRDRTAASDAAPPGLVLVEDVGPVRRLTLNRPES